MNDMPKEMQEAYLKVKEQDVPDLWSRIEAGYLKELEDMKAEKEENKVVSIESARKKRIPRGVISTLAAAVLVTIIAVPTFFNQKKNNDKDQANSDYVVGLKAEGTEMVEDSDSPQALGASGVDGLPEVTFESAAANDTEFSAQSGYLLYITTENQYYVMLTSVEGDMASEVQPYEMILVNNPIDTADLTINENPELEVQIKTPADYYGPLDVEISNVNVGEKKSCDIKILGTK